jgi:ribosomal protein L35
MQSHNLGKKTAKRKRGFRKDRPVHGTDTRAVRKMFGRRGTK